MHLFDGGQMRGVLQTVTGILRAFLKRLLHSPALIWSIDLTASWDMVMVFNKPAKFYSKYLFGDSCHCT